jgi:hypothetical protein
MVDILTTAAGLQTVPAVCLGFIRQSPSFAVLHLGPLLCEECSVPAPCSQSVCSCIHPFPSRQSSQVKSQLVTVPAGTGSNKTGEDALQHQLQQYPRCIWECAAQTLLTEVCRPLSETLGTNSETLPQMGHDALLPCALQFIIQYSPLPSDPIYPEYCPPSTPVSFRWPLALVFSKQT